MTKQILKYFALSLVLLGVALIPSLSFAQAGMASKLPGARAASSRAQAASRQAQTPGSASYTYTLLSYPGTLYTYASGINKGATSPKIEIVGGQGDGGFLVRVSEKKTVSEGYHAVNYPHEPTGQQTVFDVNDLDQIVGVYQDSSGVYHGYERTGAKFSPIDVPFAGATNTYPSGISNSGEVVGAWSGSSQALQAFTLIEGAYASFDYPGATQTSATDINNEGEIVGYYTDVSGVYHGYTLSGATYNSFDPPGSIGTFATGVNDAGDVVGFYCTTSECLSTTEGQQGFLLSGGIFTTIAVPGELLTGLDDINNNGVIVGYYQDAAGLEVSFMATP